MYRTFKSSFIFFIILINITFSLHPINNDRCRLCEGAIMIMYGLGNKFFNSSDLNKITSKYNISKESCDLFMENDLQYILSNIKNIEIDELCWKLNYCDI